MNPQKLTELRNWPLQSDDCGFAATVIRHGDIVLEVERGSSAVTDARRVDSCSKAICATVLKIASEQTQRGTTPRKMTIDDRAIDFISWAQPLFASGQAGSHSAVCGGSRIGGQLQHPGIVPICELGQFCDRWPFFSRKLVNGEMLAKLLADREDTTADRGKLIGIFEQVVQTMASAHRRGMIHCDLNPAKHHGSVHLLSGPGRSRLSGRQRCEQTMSLHSRSKTT